MQITLSPYEGFSPRWTEAPATANIISILPTDVRVLSNSYYRGRKQCNCIISTHVGLMANAESPACRRSRTEDIQLLL
jgi:hypothetical protein